MQDAALADHVRSFGVSVSLGGLGATLVNVGDSGEAFGVADNSDVRVIDLLLATDEMSNDGSLYDLDGETDEPDGEIDEFEAILRTLAKDVYSRLS